MKQEKIDFEIHLKNLIIRKCRNANWQAQYIVFVVVKRTYDYLKMRHAQIAYEVRKLRAICSIQRNFRRHLFKFGKDRQNMPTLKQSSINKSNRQLESKVLNIRISKQLMTVCVISIELKHRNLIRYTFMINAIQ